MKLLILKTNGKKFVAGERFKGGFWCVCNIVPNHFGVYLQFEIT